VKAITQIERIETVSLIEADLPSARLLTFPLNLLWAVLSAMLTFTCVERPLNALRRRVPHCVGGVRLDAVSV
jgi:peptidoglycan/LPS O-acetylase OafA/YrhL